MSKNNLQNELYGPHVPDVEVSSASVTSLEARRILTKIDLRILPILALMAMIAFLDRVSIGNAAIFGLHQDLGLKGAQYNFALCIFFIPYILFEIPSNALLKRFKPHRFISFNVFMFALTTVLQGFVTNYHELLTTRFCLGLFECGLYPGCYYLIGMWYKRDECQKRITFFFVGAIISIAFGGLLASAIGKMEGFSGLRAWRWIFILEGSLTFVAAGLGYFLIPDFPEDITWLSPGEKEWVQNRLLEDVGESGIEQKSITIRDLKVLYKDYKFILGAIMYLSLATSIYSFAYFGPTILRGWDYSLTQSQLRGVPIAFVAWFVAMIVATVSDRFLHRYFFIFGSCICTIIGFIIIMTTHSHPRAQYASLFLIFSGVVTGIPLSVCYFQANLSGHTQRAIGSAFQVSVGNIGGAISTFLFMAKDAPYYVSGYTICIGFTVLALVSTTLYTAGIMRENRIRDEMQGGEGGVEEGEKQFRYVL
ncbi:major facilitator superfamily domain-containing protein [Trichophaea hybrida]|nr:major facilitator superfamily domain-containing protein [Trichophaea hybrida]